MATLEIPARRVIVACLAVPIVLGCAALLGWAVQAPEMSRLHPQSIPMAPLTALSFILVASAMWLQVRWPAARFSRSFAAFSAGAMTLFSVIVLTQASLGRDSRLEMLILTLFSFDRGSGAGFMSPLTAGAFLAASVPLLPPILSGGRSSILREAASWASLIQAAFGATVALGYVYRAPLFYSTAIIPVALPTALAFLALGMGGLAAAGPTPWLMRNLTGTSTRSRLLRAFLPAVLLFVVLGDWVTFVLARDTQLNPAAVSFLFSLTTVALVAGLIFWQARQIGHALDAAQSALKDSEERYRSLFDSSGDGVMLLRLGQDFPVVVDANPAALKAYGYTREELIGQPLALLEPGLTAEAATERLRRMAGQGPVDLARRRKDGSMLELEAVARRVTLGPHDMIMTMQRDVAERRRAERELREAAEFSRQIIENTRDGMIVLDKDLRYRAWNRRMEEMSRIQAREILGRPAAEAFPFLASPEFFTRLRGALAGDLPDPADFAVTPPGTSETRWFSDQIGPLRNAAGEIAGVIVSVHDITERKQAEEASRENARMHQLILDSMPCVALLLRPRSREIVALNKMAAERGPRRGAVCCESWAHSAKPCPFCFAPGIWEAGEAQHRVIEWEDAVWEAHWAPVGGDLYMYYAFDISERVRGEAERERLQTQLVQSQKMESIGRLAGGVAHDFNNLLTVINGYCEMALAEAGAGGTLARQIEQIRRAGERAASLTQQLLAFSRKQMLQPRILDLNRVVGEMQPMLARLMGEDVELRLALHSGEVWVHADPHQLEQVIMNLAVNARDAMPQGGRLAIATARAERAGAATPPQAGEDAGRWAVLTVSDTGVGMDEATRQRIFEPFFTTKAAGAGTGLGLSMVQGIVGQSGGQIGVASEPGQGTTFEIRLPSPALAAPERAVYKPAPVAGGTETILLVEDQEEVRRFAAAVLSDYGYRVIEADCGGEALRLSVAEPARIDLLLTDVIMPQISGQELAVQMKQLRPGIRILFMSGHTGDLILDHGALGNDAQFIQKPFSPAQLADRVRSTLVRK